jgi:hypothetical protein
MIRRTKRDNLIPIGNGPIILRRIGARMIASQVVLYFDKQEDALLFTLAASSVLSAGGPVDSSDAVVKLAQELCKATRITAEGVLNDA